MGEQGEVVEPGSKLETLATELLVAADDYWQEYHRTMSRSHAVVWLGAKDGQTVVMTRGEHGRALRSFVEDLR